MARLGDIQRVGNKLRASDLDSISTEGLYTLLTKATGSMTRRTLIEYIKTLERLGYIKFEDYRWKILRPKSGQANLKI